uniref:Molybdopterin biosynthesis protein n=1 Tax=Centroceras clavulatum TaxID=159503 RepID=A0A4D6WQU1_9FLOR|nr:Molybdopterin biosynthesis protein [Centroceras clavulatum]
MNLDSQEYQQYSKQVILENIGISGQKRLKKAKVLIIGLGGLGCPSLLYLATSGIGTIGVIDDDYINLSNLNRQILYNTNDLNTNKTFAASSFIKKINTKCKVLTYSYKLSLYNAFEIIKNYDLIIDATDNFKTRYIIDEICYKLHKIHIYGAINQYEGQVSVFNYKNYVRYSDLYPKKLKLKNISCEDYGILGVMTGIIGILQAIESLKIILGIGTLLSGTIIKYNLLNTSIKKVKIHLFKHNYDNEQKAMIKSQIIDNKYLLKIQEINQMNKNKIIILDIRERIEFDQYHLNKTINIPIIYWKTKKTLDLILYNFYKYKIIIACNKLEKSLTVSYILLKHNIKAYIIQMS